MTRKAIYSLLSNDATLTGIVSDRIFPVRMPPTADFPAVTYQLVDNQPYETKQSVSSYDEGGFQINVFAEKYSDAIDAVAAIRNVLDGYSGTVDGVKIPHIVYESDEDNFSKDPDVYWQIMRFRVDEDKS